MSSLRSDDSGDDSGSGLNRVIHRKARVICSSDEESNDEVGLDKISANVVVSKNNCQESKDNEENMHSERKFDEIGELSVDVEKRKDSVKSVNKCKSLQRSFLKSNLITDSDIESDDSTTSSVNGNNLGESSVSHHGDMVSYEEIPVKRKFKSKLITESDIESGDSNHSSVTSENKNRKDDDEMKTLEHTKMHPKFDSDKEDCGYETQVADKKKRKKTKKQLLDEKLAIRSETQRMVREASAHLPYHRPKQRGLREFLSRKKQEIPINCLRVNSSMMADTWGVLNENMKESIDFFKSESDDEENLSEHPEEHSNNTETNFRELNQELEKTSSIVADAQQHPVSSKVIDENPDEMGRETCEETNFQSRNDVTEEIPEVSYNCVTNMVDGKVQYSDEAATSPNVGSEIPNIVNQSQVGVHKESETILPSESDPNLDQSTKEVSSEVPVKPVGPKPSSALHSGEAILVNQNDGLGLNNLSNALPLALDEKSCADKMDHEKTPSGADKAAKWLEEIVSYEKVEAVKKKLQLSPGGLKKVPTLSRGTHDIIDLDSPEKIRLCPGALQLMDRLLKAQPVKLPKNIEVSTTAAERNEKGEITNISVETITITSDTMLAEDGPPGGKLHRLRENLKSKIEGKWEEEFKKRCTEFGENGKEGFEENIEDDVEEELEEEDVTSESEPEENDIPLIDKTRESCAFGDSEAEESDGEDGDDEGEDDDVAEGDGSLAGEDEELCNEASESADDDMDNCTLPPYQPMGMVPKGEDTPTQNKQQLNSFSPALSLTGLTPKIQDTPGNTERNVCETPLTTASLTSCLKTPLSVRKTVGSSDAPSIMKNLFGKDSPVEKPLYEPVDPDDPFMFVSGAFPDPSEASQAQPPQSQNKPRRILLQDESDDSCEPDMNKQMLTDGPENNEGEANDNAEVHDEAKPHMPTGVLFSPAKSAVDIVVTKKKRKQLTFSDDEDSGEEEQEMESADGVGSEVEGENALSEQEEISDNEDNPVEYDSEENEVQPVKPSEFFENEAELSESEWSGDEDEQGLDKMDAEAGDADQLDEEQVASQLGKIHMRRMLDQDARDVRLLQEILFEDGDLHSDGKGRERKFRWKNLTGFDRNDLRGDGGSDSDGEVDQEEAKLAKLRHEKVQILLQLEKEEEKAFEEDSEKASLLKLGRQLLNKIQSQPALKQMKSKVTRPSGSFLCKEASFLSQIAKVARNGKDAPLGPSHSKNFVFSALSPENEKTSSVQVIVQSEKRKSLTYQETSKRAKLTPKLSNKVSILEQLH